MGIPPDCEHVLHQVKQLQRQVVSAAGSVVPIGNSPENLRSGIQQASASREARIAKKEMVEANLKETVTRVLASLTPREERVLGMRFGDRDDARGGRAAVQRDARTNPADRGKGAKEAQASEPVVDTALRSDRQLLESLSQFDNAADVETEPAKR
jgi:DNA-directed RNA polymerase sigma subunit (sigma70/sigma32)